MIVLVPCRLARERRPPSDSRRRRTEGQLNRHSFPYESRRDTTRSLPTFASLLIPEREESYKVGRNSPSAVDPVAFEPGILKSPSSPQSRWWTDGNSSQGLVLTVLLGRSA